MKAGNRIELTLEKLALAVKRRCLIDSGMVVFVQGGIPGDRGMIEITKRKKNLLWQTGGTPRSFALA